MRLLLRAATAAVALAFPGAALAGTSAGQPFPSNLYSTPDASQITGIHVDLPRPDCTARPSDCADIAILDTLDGFNIQPRISVPFSGPIDPSTASSHTIFLVGPRGHVVGINQIEWEPAANTLHFESDQQLDQDSTYLLVVTRGVHDAAGHPLDELSVSSLWQSAPPAYRHDLLRAIPAAFVAGVDPANIAAASVFTTQSITAISQRIRHQLRGSSVDFNLGTHGERTVFPVASITSAVLNRQNGPTLSPPSPLLLPALQNQVSTLAFGTFASPNYETADEVIPPVGTRTGVPAVQSINHLQFTLWLPNGQEPRDGWPVAIFGHGFTDSKDGAPWAVAGTFARNGIATIAINVVGHGGGPAGTYNVTSGGSTVTLPSGGRAIDQNGDGNFDSTEGVSAVGAQSLIGNRDGLRQTTIDLMQLVATIEGGIDVTGDHHPDLSRKLIYYAGQSFGGIYGVQLLGLEPDIRAGVPNVPGGPIIEIARLSPSFRPLVGISLLQRTPVLYNTFPPDPFVSNFRENMPLRNLPTVIDTVPGASAIQTLIDNTEWAQQAANPAAYAPYIQNPVIIQFARGDMTVPNPTTSAILRAGHLAGRATLFRNDLANADFGTSKNPHTFLTNIVGPGAPFAFEAQQQIATFFASDGATVIDPDGAGKYFETPTSIVPEDLAFLP